MIVYLITNLINGKVYVGKTAAKLETRWCEHKSRARQLLNNALYKAIREHGSDNFALKVIHEVQPGEDGDALEQKWIAMYHSDDPAHGYNMTAGGKGMVGFKGLIGSKLRPETRAKISASTMGRASSEKQKIAVSRAHKGKAKPLEQRVKMAAHWDENRRDEQAEMARQLNAQQNSKLKDYLCDACGQSFQQVTRGFYGGHRKACLRRSNQSGPRPWEAERRRIKRKALAVAAS